jgi:hypothetical protein
MIENLCNKDQRHSETLGWVNTSLGMKTILPAQIFFFDEQKGTAVLKLFWGNVFWGNVTKGI